MERLKISENKRYLVTEDGKPFIWMADTAWTLPQRVKFDDAEYYMQTRKRQGFTVLQIVALDPERDEQMRTPAGDPALIDGDILKPNENYFRYLDRILEMAASYGFYVLLVPAWGQLITGDNWSGETFNKTITEENAYAYGKWIGDRYGKYKHILWCLGGDRQPIHRQKYDYRNVFRRMAEGLGRALTGKDLKYNEKDPAWEELLITYHACYEGETGKCSTFSYWTDEEAWITFIMLQSGHGKAAKNYELIKAEYDRERTMPVFDGEPAYELMPTCWPIKDLNDFHGTKIVRTRAYCGLLAGEFGHTYGHANVWCFVSERERNFISRTDWFDSIHSEGSSQIKYIHSFMAGMEAYAAKPAQEILIRQSKEDLSVERHMQAAYTNGGETISVYFPMRAEEELDLSAWRRQEKIYGWWFDPRTGAFSKAEIGEGDTALIKTPGKEEEEDWLLILTKKDEEPFEILNFETSEEKESIKKVFEW